MRVYNLWYGVKFRQWDHWCRTSHLSPTAKKRLAWFDYYLKHQRNASLTCRHFGIARKTFYAWRRRFNPRVLTTLESTSSRPHRLRQPLITPSQEQRVIAVRKQHLRWGKLKLQRIYCQTYQELISTWHIQRTIAKYRLYANPAALAKLRRSRQRALVKKRITQLRRQPFPGFLVALDGLTIYWNGLTRYILTAIDHASKIAFARMYTTKSSRSAADFLQRVYLLLEGGALNTLHDNGSEFSQEFRTACQALHLEQYWTRVRTPTDNPVVERFNRTLREEFIQLGHFTPDPTLFNRTLTEWLIEYTFVRPHQALGYDTPWQFYQKTAKVLPRYPSSTRA